MPSMENGAIVIVHVGRMVESFVGDVLAAR